MGTNKHRASASVKGQMSFVGGVTSKAKGHNNSQDLGDMVALAWWVTGSLLLGLLEQGGCASLLARDPSKWKPRLISIDGVLKFRQARSSGCLALAEGVANVTRKNAGEVRRLRGVLRW